MTAFFIFESLLQEGLLERLAQAAKEGEEADEQPLKIRKTVSLDSGNEASSEDSNDSSVKNENGGNQNPPGSVKDDKDIECKIQHMPYFWLILILRVFGRCDGGRRRKPNSTGVCWR